jgi:hypothetical protein
VQIVSGEIQNAYSLAWDLVANSFPFSCPFLS